MADIQGCILRASAADTQTDILVREGKILKEAWEQMSQHFEGSNAQLIMAGPDAIQRTLSDHATKHVERIEVVIMQHYTYVEDWCSIFAPDLVTKIAKSEVQDRRNSDRSIMFPALLNRLNAQEVRDLISYLQSVRTEPNP